MDEALISFPEECRVATFLYREKRFFVHALLDGREIVAHTNNTGAMLGLLRRGAPALLSPARDPRRRLRWTLEALGQRAEGKKFWAGVNTLIPNRVLAELFRQKLMWWTEGYESLKREAANGESRLDGLFLGAGRIPLWVECKNVTLVEDGAAAFPDAVTDRGVKHLRTLTRLREEGHRAAMLYVVQRPDGQCFRAADYIDPAYATALHEAFLRGVEVYAVVVRVERSGVYYAGELPFRE